MEAEGAGPNHTLQEIGLYLIQFPMCPATFRKAHVEDVQEMLFLPVLCLDVMKWHLP